MSQFWRTEAPNRAVYRAVCFPWRLSGRILPCPFQLLGHSLGWSLHSNFCLCLHILYVCLLLHPFYEHLSLGLGPTWLIQRDLISRSLTYWHHQRSFFQIKSHSHVLWIRRRTHLWGNRQSTHYSIHWWLFKNVITYAHTPTVIFFEWYIQFCWPLFIWLHGMHADLSQPGLKPVPLLWKHAVLTTGPPEKSAWWFLIEAIIIMVTESWFF